MTDTEDVPPPDLTCDIVQFGPIVRGFKCVFLLPVAAECEGDDPEDERYTPVVRDVQAFGVGAIRWGKNSTVEPISMFLERGEWVVANKELGYCGIFVADGSDHDNTAAADKLLENLDPYFKKRLLRDTPSDDEGSR